MDEKREVLQEWRPTSQCAQCRGNAFVVGNRELCGPFGNSLCFVCVRALERLAKLLCDFPEEL